MTDREALLRAICNNPDDNVPRLVFADWLQENGEPERAEFIRLQCEAVMLPTDATNRTTIDARIDELLKLHEQKWIAELKNPHEKKKGWDRQVDWGENARGWLELSTFDRGFPTQLWVRTTSILEQFPWLLSDVTPVRGLMIHNMRNAFKLHEMPLLRHLATFRCRVITRDTVEGLTTCPHLQPIPDVRLPMRSLPQLYIDRLYDCYGDRLQPQG